MKFRLASCLPDSPQYQFPGHFRRYQEIQSSSTTSETTGNNGNNKSVSANGTATRQDYLGSHSHDAGYDAVMTALTFLFQTEYILGKKALSWVDLGSVENIYQLSLNKIRLVRTTPNVIDMASKESRDSLAASKKHFFMWGYPADWKK